jgi:hypothetical protein
MKGRNKQEVTVMNRWRAMLGVCSLMLVAGNGCIRIKSDPVEVKPIYITVDVNLKVERELEDFFDDLDAKDPTITEEESETGTTDTEEKE